MIKRWTLAIGAILVSATFAFALDGRVERIIDGDTMVIAGKYIRVWGIDSPESDQPGGMEATEFARNILQGKEVHVDEKGTDRYGRLIGEVKVDGADYGTIMVREGMARCYYQYARGATWLLKAETEASRLKKGIWAIEGQVPPWEWRRKHK